MCMLIWYLLHTSFLYRVAASIPITRTSGTPVMNQPLSMLDFYHHPQWKSLHRNWNSSPFLHQYSSAGQRGPLLTSSALLSTVQPQILWSCPVQILSQNPVGVALVGVVLWPPLPLKVTRRMYSTSLHQGGRHHYRVGAVRRNICGRNKLRYIAMMRTQTHDYNSGIMMSPLLCNHMLIVRLHVQF